MTVTGQFGFSVTAGPIVIQAPSAIVVTSSSNESQITVSASGGTGPYTYSLDGLSPQILNVFNNVPNGIHTVTVFDANGCSQTIQVPVAANSLLGIAAETQSITCFGGNNGVITVTAAGSNPPFEYSLNGGNFQSSNVFAGLTAGTYTINVRDASFMTAFTNAVILTEPTQVVVNASADVNDVTVNISGGTSPYTLLINDVETEEQYFPDLAAGIYTFVATDANGCSATSEVEALGNTMMIFFQAVGPISCTGSNDGIIGVCVDGGYGTLTATISPEAGNNESTSNGNCHLVASFLNLPPGNYEVTITDSLGFSIVTGATITSPDPLEITAANVGNTITASVTGGTFSYEYSLDGINWQPESEFTDLPNGLYTVYVRDIRGCIASTEFLLDVDKTIDLATIWGVQVSPNPGSGMFQLMMANAPDALHVDVVELTGKILHRLDFNPGNGNFQTQIDLQNLPQGIYLLRLTDGVRTGALRVSIVR